MEIRNDAKNIHFNAKIRTVKVLEAVTMRCTESDSIADLKPIIDEFWGKPFKAAGNRGYRYYIKIIGDKILEKYPEIRQAAEEIQNYLSKNPNAKKRELSVFVKPIIEKIGETIDIVL